MTKPDLAIHVPEQLDRGLAYGEACFETFRVIDGEVVALDAHLERLAKGLNAFGIGLDGGARSSIADAALAAATERGRDQLVRITVTGGRAPWGLMRHGEPEVFVQCMPYAPSGEAIHLRQVEWPFPLLPKVAKFSSDYALTLRAMQQWKLKKGISPLICKDGRVLSSLTANVMILRDGIWLTPDDAEGGVLPGVIRSILIDKGLAEVANCPVAWLKDCDALLLTNSSGFAMPATSVDGRFFDPEIMEIEVVYELLHMLPGVKI